MKDISRNQPGEDGKNHDPHLRDRSAQQPGINTISSSENDDDNQSVTKTAVEGDNPKSKDPNADKKFDD